MKKKGLLMSVTVSQVIEDVKSLSAKERALLAHCLIPSKDSFRKYQICRSKTFTLILHL